MVAKNILFSGSGLINWTRGSSLLLMTNNEPPCHATSISLGLWPLGMNIESFMFDDLF